MAIDIDYFKGLGLDDEAAEKALNDIGEFTSEQRKGVDAKNRELLAKLSETKKALTSFEGIDPEQAREALEKLHSLDEQELIDKGQYDKLVENLVAKHADEKKSLAKQNDEIRASLEAERKALEDSFLRAEITSAIASKGASIDLLMLPLRNEARIISDNGKNKIVIVDSDGDPRLNSEGKQMTLSERVAEMEASDSYAPAFPSSGLSGGDARRSSRAGSIDTSKMSSRQKMAAGRRN